MQEAYDPDNGGPDVMRYGEVPYPMMMKCQPLPRSPTFTRHLFRLCQPLPYRFQTSRIWWV